MKKEIITLEEKKLVGISARTNNASLFEADPTTNIIAATVQKYFYNGMSEKVKNKKNPGTTLCAYTQYESDVNGDYTFFIGEEVLSFENIEDGMEMLTIPAQKYAQFTNQTPGPMPDVCINMWKDIWTMNASDLGGERAYIADFEVYDARSVDHQKVTLDICIGIGE